MQQKVIILTLSSAFWLAARLWVTELVFSSFVLKTALLPRYLLVSPFGWKALCSLNIHKLTN